MVHVFIVNPEHTAPDFYNELRDRLSRIPDLTYYVFTTGVAGDETELARTVESIFEGEQLRIYSCGNTTSARNILDGLSDIGRVELAIVPYKQVQYLSAISDIDRFKDIESLIEGRVIHVDYLRTNHGVALNSAAFGLDAYMCKVYESIDSLRILGRAIPGIVASIYSLITCPNIIFSIEYKGMNPIRKATSVYIGNVPVVYRKMRYSENNDITDGEATLNCIYWPEFFTRFRYYFKLIRNIPATYSEKHYLNCQIDSVRIRHINGVPLLCSLDNKLVSASDWKIEVVKQGLRLVVPREVSQ